MLVRDLIEKLESMPQDVEVRIESSSGEYPPSEVGLVFAPGEYRETDGTRSWCVVLTDHD